MQAGIELSLSHDGQAWCADGLAVPVHGTDLETLQAQIVNAIRADPRFEDECPLPVVLRFDMTTIPRWLHQYHSHYFNYSFTVNREHREQR